MTAKDELLRQATGALQQAGLEDPRREARLLLGWATQRDLAGLFSLTSVSEVEANRFQVGVERRVAREPLAFIVGETGFWTLDFYTSPDTLIPRGDSEALIEALLAVRPDRTASLSMLDLGTGTGCLLLSALSEYPNSWGVGVDLAPGAATLARRNAVRNGLGSQSCFVAGNWDSALDGKFDVVISNPPYIESADVPELMPEVSRYEPARALDGGRDGLDAYRLLCNALPDLLAPGGHAVLEMGIGQIDAVSALGRARGLREVARQNDLGGIARALVLQRTEN
ncbi:protein methyltransferase HemK [Gluconobacter thailandicus F149-1 = NBRC 100600]|uniref:Release factor glutamine methyltransferase n=1 Tax=Gluconobacter thailandicus NBRC 3257 TaxID=1381097 RepID=A0ABQ0ISA2_GLUTH|nr:peptide chain release factor N(5)-glutamine methyltransferase [Gluconobacter thailandicus]AFW02049.1 HemK family protein [Gluconobacter oxydans H24]ANQ42384.1 protein-(glutamine-N5) methyltransferase, release factor-specific [Gluconobacter oxydans]KXV53231.1 SAM-dependent methyltransferase [Gluconobacter thailandicus]GAC86875.1 HemK family protein [Gluconobacter thailandicus NBRC 3255]GAD25066.1 HemK family protein [Gluconobacter thailandicus NBRC 3257]